MIVKVKDVIFFSNSKGLSLELYGHIDGYVNDGDGNYVLDKTKYLSISKDRLFGQLESASDDINPFFSFNPKPTEKQIRAILCNARMIIKREHFDPETPGNNLSRPIFKTTILEVKLTPDVIADLKNANKYLEEECSLVDDRYLDKLDDFFHWPYEEESIEDDNESDYDSCYYREHREERYDKYNGSYAQDELGYSDDDIDTIFDGNPDAYWNID